jgi:quinol monooxygenase YgiN
VRLAPDPMSRGVRPSTLGIPPHRGTAVYVAQFTLHAKPGHYSQVADLYSTFAREFLATHEALESVLIVGDEGSGAIRGIGVFQDRLSADQVNSDPEFAAFNDAVGPLLAEPPDRVELELLHLYTKNA